MALKQPVDLGTVYSKTSAQGFTNSPTVSSTLNADRASKLRAEVLVTLVGGSTAGNVTVSAKASRDGTNFWAIPITDDGAGTSGATGTVTTGAGTTVRKGFTIDPSGYKGGVQFTIQSAAATTSGDTCVVTVEAA